MKLMYIWAVLKDDESFSRLSLHTHYKTSKIFSFFNSTTPSHTTCILSRKGLFQSFGVSLATRALPALSYIGIRESIQHSFEYMYVCTGAGLGLWKSGFCQTWYWALPKIPGSGQKKNLRFWCPLPKVGLYSYSSLVFYLGMYLNGHISK